MRCFSPGHQPQYQSIGCRAQKVYGFVLRQSDRADPVDGLHHVADLERLDRFGVDRVRSPVTADLCTTTTTKQED
jgi:hypothetical protein